MANVLQKKNNPLSYQRVDWGSLKNTTPKSKPAKAAYPKGTVIGTGAATNTNQLKKAMGSKAYNAIPSYKKGGKVKKTGPAKLHKGEHVLTKKQASKWENMKKKVFGIKKYGKG